MKKLESLVQCKIYASNARKIIGAGAKTHRSYRTENYAGGTTPDVETDYQTWINNLVRAINDTDTK